MVGPPGAGARVGGALAHDARVGAAVRQVVRGRTAQRLGQLPRPPRRRRQRRPRRAALGGRARGRHAGPDLPRAARARRAGVPRARVARRRRGRPCGDLPADDPRGRGRDARLRADRCAALGHLRWLRRRGAQRPDPRRRRPVRDHRGRRLPPRRRRPAQAPRRRGARTVPGRDRRPRRAAHRRRRGVGRGAGSLVARGRRRAADRARARGLRRRAPALPHVHVRHDGEAQGHLPHDGRLPDARRGHLQVRVRPAPRDRRRLDRCGHRLGDRAQLHRLRPARERRDRGALRGRAGRRGPGPVVAHRRGLQGLHPLHRADHDPHPHEVGRGAACGARPVVAARPRLGRRAHQPRGVDVVPRARRRRAMPGRRHVVADRDRAGS